MKSILSDYDSAKNSYLEARHLFEVSYKLNEDVKMFVKVVDKVDFSVRALIAFILKMEYVKNKVRLSKNKDRNLKLFFDNFEKFSGLESKEKAVIKEILRIGELHRKSGFDFGYDGKLFMLFDEGVVEELPERQIVSFLSVLEKLLLSVSRNFSQ